MFGGNEECDIDQGNEP